MRYSLRNGYSGWAGCKQLAQPTIARSQPSITDYDNRLLIVCGGFVPQQSMQFLEAMGSVELYDMDQDVWSTHQIDNLNVPRGRHGSCTLNSFIYVFCGQTYNSRALNNVERFNLNTLGQTQSSWQLIEVDQRQMPARISPVVSVIGCGSDILVMGGYSQQGNIRMDAYRFKVVEEAAEQEEKARFSGYSIVKCSEYFKFPFRGGIDNQCAMSP